VDASAAAAVAPAGTAAQVQWQVQRQV